MKRLIQQRTILVQRKYKLEYDLKNKTIPKVCFNLLHSITTQAILHIGHKIQTLNNTLEAQ
jgi:hypothetical protein